MANWTTRIGTEIAGHRVEKLIGRGGMSVVYLAEHRGLGTRIALKVLAPSFMGDEDFQERFRQESRMAASLDHPNVIPIYDAGEDAGMLYIAMRYIDGPDLGSLVEKEGSLPLSRMLFIIEQIAGALDAAHAAGLVHRDVKPQNILLETAQDRAYLSDFGIVKHTLTGQSLTRTGSFLGTVQYSSPEQIEGRPVDARTDVYALGGVAYYCLVGSAPYEKDTEVAVMNAHITEPPPALNVVRPDLPAALGHVIATAMAKDMDDRYDSCLAFSNALRAAAMLRSTDGFRGFGGAAPADAPGPDWLDETRISAGGPREPAFRAPASQSASTLPRGGGSFGVPAEDPAGPPVSPAPRGTGRAAIAALVLLAVLVGAGGSYLAFGRGSSPKPAPNPVAVNRNCLKPTRVRVEDVALCSEIPRPIRSSCTIVPPAHAGTLSAATCDYVDPKHGRTLIHVHSDRNAANLSVDYRHHGTDPFVVAGGRLLTDKTMQSGNCSNTDWLGEGSWSHEGTDMAGMGDGRRVCYQLHAACPLAVELKLPDQTQQCSLIAWTNDASTLFGIAEQPTLVHGELYQWWSFWVHMFG